MTNRVMLPLDGSPLAERILPYAAWLATSTRADVELVRVVETPMPVDGEAAYGDYLTRIQALAREQARAALAATQRRLADAGVSARAAVFDSDGSPIAEQIAREAERVPGTVIAVSTHGRSGVGRWLLGSVTDKLLQGTHCPLFVVHPPEGTEEPGMPWRPATVVVPLDGSPVAERALPVAVELATAAALRVHLVRVVTDGDDDVAAARDQLRDRVAEIAGTLPGGATFDVLRGDPAGALVAAAKVIPDNLIVMTTHGRGGIERWLIGSVTDRVVRYSRDPVLVVRAS